MSILTNFERCNDRKTGLQYINGEFVCSKCGHPLSFVVMKTHKDIISFECEQCGIWVSVTSGEDASHLTEIKISLEKLYFKYFENKNPEDSSTQIIDDLKKVYKEFFDEDVKKKR